MDVACGFESSGLSPNLWWPDDRSWIVVTEIDGYSTYVGGSLAAITEIVTSLDVEAIEVSLEVCMDPGPYPPRWRSSIGAQRLGKSSSEWTHLRGRSDYPDPGHGETDQGQADG